MHPNSHRHLPLVFCGLFTAMVLAGGTQIASAQQQGLKAVGPNDPVSGYPLWYEDFNGLKLGLSTDPLAGFLVPDPTRPPSFPTSATDTTFNWPDEMFYWTGTGLMFGPAGEKALLVLALEAAFSIGPVQVGDNITFARVRIRLSGMVPGATYTITHPYGTQTVVADDVGFVFETRDIGIGAPGGPYTGPLHGDIGPFLLPQGFGGGAPGDLIDQGLVDTQVQGSPFGTNYFQIDGPGAGTIFFDHSVSLTRARQSVFSLTGQIANRFGVRADQVSYSKNSGATSVNVWASSAAGQSLVASIDGSVDIPLVENAATGGYFLRAELGAGAPQPLSLTLTNTSDIPPTSITVPIADQVVIRSAAFTIGGDLIVSASSSDITGAQTLSGEIDGGIAIPLASAGLGDVAGPLGLPASTTPPQTVLVTSSGGGSVSAPVEVFGLGTLVGGGTPVIANAGPDQTVLSGDNVVLDGAGSLGPVVSYQWTHDAGTLISLSDAFIANPKFQAPGGLPGGALDINFTLTVFDLGGLSTSDATVVHVSDPVAPAPDKITITVARYNSSKKKWRIDGTAKVLQNQIVNVYLGDEIGPNLLRFVGSGTVDAIGLWRFRGGNGSAVNDNSVPQAGETFIWGISELPGEQGPFQYRFK